MNGNKLIIEYIKENYRYDPFDGEVAKVKTYDVRLINKVGTLVGVYNRTTGHNEIKIKFKNKEYVFLYQDICWLLYYNEFPENKIYHVDGNIMNNEIENLQQRNV